MNKAIDRATALLIETNKPHIVYRRNGKLAVISLQAYLDADLDSKGATRITVITRNTAGKII